MSTVNDIIEELLNLDMEPKPESLWWTRSYLEEDKLRLQVGGGGKDGNCRSGRSSRCWGNVFSVMGKAHKGSERLCAKEWAAGGATLIFIVRQSVSLKTKRQRVISHVFSTALNSSANWTWNVYNARLVHSLGDKDSSLNLQTQNATGRRVGRLQSTHCSYAAYQVEEIGSAIFGKIVC